MHLRTINHGFFTNTNISGLGQLIPAYVAIISQKWLHNTQLSKAKLNDKGTSSTRRHLQLDANLLLLMIPPGATVPIYTFSILPVFSILISSSSYCLHIKNIASCISTPPSYQTTTNQAIKMHSINIHNKSGHDQTFEVHGWANNQNITVKAGQTSKIPAPDGSSGAIIALHEGHEGEQVEITKNGYGGMSCSILNPGA